MAFVTLSSWTATEMADEMIATANEKFVSMIMAVGAGGVQMVRTGDLSLCVVTHYSDAATADSAQAKIAKIRGKAATEFPMTTDSAHRRVVIASA